MFRSIMVLLLSGLFLAGVTSCGLFGGGEGEEKVSLDDVPVPVNATILKEAAGAEIIEIERETEDGKVVYEAEFEADGVITEVTVAADGTLLEREVEDDDDDEEDDDDDDDDDHDDGDDDGES